MEARFGEMPACANLANPQETSANHGKLCWWISQARHSSSAPRQKATRKVTEASFPSAGMVGRCGCQIVEKSYHPDLHALTSLTMSGVECHEKPRKH